MIKSVVLYARVSLEMQAGDDMVSIEQQIEEMEGLCERNGWKLIAMFKDTMNYRATMNPNKGKIVNPSGERADRPQFLAMLELVKSGGVDAIVCWRTDRLVRHTRVAVALEDAMEVADRERKGRDEVEIYEATGALISRTFLHLGAWWGREENKRRAERGRMGKNGTLQDGRWPGEFRRYGYKSVKVPGHRGRVIEIDPEQAPIVRKIFEMYVAGQGIAEIRRYLIREKVPQIYTMLVKHEWSRSLITGILKSSEYLGKATWTFKDGKTVVIDIPPLIEPELYKKAQERIARNKRLATRNAKGVYLLQGLLYCGDCNHHMSITRNYGKVRYAGGYGYRCHTVSHNPHEPHPRPTSISGAKLDEAVWRQIVDYGLKQPELLKEQILAKVRKAQAEGSGAASEIARITSRIREIEDERMHYQRQAARGKMTDEELDKHMDETQEQLDHWKDEVERLRVLRDNYQKVEKAIRYAETLFAKLMERVERLDYDRQTLDTMPEEEQEAILKERQAIIRALVERVTVNSQRHVVIEGVLDGTEGAQFDVVGC